MKRFLCCSMTLFFRIFTMKRDLFLKFSYTASNEIFINFIIVLFALFYRQNAEIVLLLFYISNDLKSQGIK